MVNDENSLIVVLRIKLTFPWS